MSEEPANPREFEIGCGAIVAIALVCFTVYGVVALLVGAW